MQFHEWVMANRLPIGIGFSMLVIIISGAMWPGIKGRRRPKCYLTPLEVRAHDVAEALNELDEALTSLQGDNKFRGIPSEVMPSWIKARTAGKYLERFLVTGR